MVSNLFLVANRVVVEYLLHPSTQEALGVHGYPFYSEVFPTKGTMNQFLSTFYRKKPSERSNPQVFYIVIDDIMMYLTTFKRCQEQNHKKSLIAIILIVDSLSDAFHQKNETGRLIVVQKEQLAQSPRLVYE